MTKYLWREIITNIGLNHIKSRSTPPKNDTVENFLTIMAIDSSVSYKSTANNCLLYEKYKLYKEIEENSLRDRNLIQETDINDPRRFYSNFIHNKSYCTYETNKTKKKTNLTYFIYTPKDKNTTTDPYGPYQQFIHLTHSNLHCPKPPCYENVQTGTFIQALHNAKINCIESKLKEQKINLALKYGVLMLIILILFKIFSTFTTQNNSLIQFQA